MNAYLITAGVTHTQLRPAQGSTAGMNLRTWDTCFNAIVFAGSSQEAEQKFVHSVERPPEGEQPLQTDIKNLVSTQFVDQLLTESGAAGLDWSEIIKTVRELLEATAVDEFEQGYWVDVNQALPADAARISLDSLQQSLPEDVASGLNWSTEKRFLFLVSALKLALPPPEPVEDFDLEPGSSEAPDSEEDPAVRHPLDPTVAALPEMREKESVAVVEARNSVVAACLWRKFIADKSFANNDILVSPMCPLLADE